MSLLSSLRRLCSRAAVAAVAAALAGCASETADPARIQAISSLTASVEDGKTAYESQCSRCHGTDGKSGSAARNTPGEASQNLSSAISIVLTGEDEMPSFSHLSDQNIADILGYLKTLN